MPDTTARPDPTLTESLTAHARAVSGRRVVLDLVGGALAVMAGALWRPRGWPAVVAAGVCFVAFGAWALAERRLAGPNEGWPASERGGRVLAWRAVRTTAAVVGSLAAVLLGFALLFGVLGTWIS